MLATTHLSFTERLVRGRPASAWAMAGSVLPDAPAILRGAWLAARPRASADPLFGQIYETSPWGSVHRSVHAVWGPLLLAAVVRDDRARALAAGWAGHVAVDLATHADDAWPPLWPLSTWRRPSPISYWQRDRHARAVMAADLAANALLLGRHRSLAAGLALAVSAATSLLPVAQGR